MKALIASGGHGTRLRPITHTQNKHMIPVANKPILHYAIDYVVEAGIKEIAIVVNAGQGEVQEIIGDGSKWGVKISYLEQEAPLGLSHVVKIAEKFINGDDFVFYLGDNMVVGGIKPYIDAFKANNSEVHLTLSKVKDPERFGVPELKGNQIIGIEEKPKNPKSQYAVAGIYIYKNKIFEAIHAIKPSPRGELEISDAHQYMLDKGYKVTYSEITGWWKDTGKPVDLLEANRLILDNIQTRIDGNVDKESLVSGRVIIEKGAKIINSVLRGPLIIGNDAVIENSYIGPFTSIDKKTVVKNSEVEFSMVLESCLIDSVGIRIEGSLLGRNASVIKAHDKPKTNRFMIGDQSVVEVG